MDLKRQLCRGPRFKHLLMTIHVQFGFNHICCLYVKVIIHFPLRLPCWKLQWSPEQLKTSRVPSNEHFYNIIIKSVLVSDNIFEISATMSRLLAMAVILNFWSASKSWTKKNHLMKGQSWSYGSWIYNYLFNRCLSPLMLWVWIPLIERCTTLCDKVCQWLAAGRWFSTCIQISSTIKNDCHDITEKNPNQTPNEHIIIYQIFFFT